MSTSSTAPAPQHSASTRVTVIVPTAGFRLLDPRELWRYRELVLVLAARDIRVRYKQTALGALWALLQPLLQLAVFSVLFGRLAGLPSDGLPYPVFVFAGLLPWMFFSAALTNASGSVVASANLVSKVYFPRLIIPLASLGSATVDAAIGFVVLLALLGVFGVMPGLSALLLPLVIVGIAAVALGVGSLLAALTVAYRDFRHVVPFMIQLWFFATPVLYPTTLIPPAWQPLLHLNPLTSLVDAFRLALTGGRVDATVLTLGLVASVLVLAGGLLVFARVERRFADIV